MFSRKINYSIICFCLLLQVIAQSPTFKITEKGWVTSSIPNNSTIYTVTIPSKKIVKDLDIVNLTNSYQDIILRKSELIVNTVSSSDKALASYCYAIFCRTPEAFADTVTFIPNQTVPISFDFIEASYPGRSLILYTISNKNSAESSNIYMNYQGVVSITENLKQNSKFKLFPNPSNGQIFISSETQTDLSNAKIFVKDCLGKNVLEQGSDFNSNKVMLLDLQSLNKGIYFVQIENQSQQVFHQLISIE